MALLKFHDGTQKLITREQGNELWAILTGKKEPNEKQAKFLLSVDRLFLNWRNAPDDYLIQYKEFLIPMVKKYWMVEAFELKPGEHKSNGNPTRPDPTDEDCIRVSRVLGLTHHTQNLRPN